jgi:HSP90 family molecular chaperone
VEDKALSEYYLEHNSDKDKKNAANFIAEMDAVGLIQFMPHATYEQIESSLRELIYPNTDAILDYVRQQT